MSDREATCARLRRQTGATLIPPYDHPDVIAGQGTIGVEFLEQVPDLDAIVVPVSGGGMISGIALAVKALNPDCLVLAAEPGGECAHLREVDGDADCTWHAEPLGHVTLDELMETEGIVDHRGSTGLNQREYKSCFWDERHDAQRNRERVKALDRKFREKYPQIPGDIPAPLCGW